MRQNIWGFYLCLVLSATAAGLNAGQPEERGKTDAVIVPHGPKLDGTLADPLWQKAPPLALGPVTKADPDPALLPATARVLFDDQFVYIGFDCEEPETNSLKTDAKKRDDEVWQDDCIEIFISPDLEKGYKHIAVNPAGAIFDQECAPDGKGMNPGWDGHEQVQAAVGAKNWTVTAAIPFTDLATEAGEDLTWRLNLTRSRPPHGAGQAQYSSWAVLPSPSFHQPASFGSVSKIKVPAGKSAAAPAPEESLKNTAELRASLETLVQRCGSDDFAVRESAEQKLNSFVREKGQAAADILRRGILPAVKKEGDVEVVHRVENVLKQLFRPQPVWEKTFPSHAMGINQGTAACLREGRVAQLHGMLGALNLVLDQDVKKTPEQFWVGNALLKENTIYAIERAANFPNSSTMNLVAYSRKDGSQLWKTDITELNPQKEFINAAMAADDSGNVAVYLDNFCVAWFDKNGKQLWASQAKRENYKWAFEPLVSSELGLVFAVRAEKELIALRTATGETAWTYPTKHIRSQPALSGERLYAVGSPDDYKHDQLFCFNAKTGEIVWRRDMKEMAPASTLAKAAIADGGKAVIASGWQGFYKLNAEDGKLLWTVPFLFSYNPNTFIVDHDIIYAAARDGLLIAVDSQTGFTRWRLDLNKLDAADAAPKGMDFTKDKNGVQTLGNLSTPAVVGDMLYVSTDGGWVVALSLPPFKEK